MATKSTVQRRRPADRVRGAMPAAPASAAPARAELGVTALERGLSILDAFGSGAGTLSLAQLAAATGLYKSTILRMCSSLLRLGYLHRLGDGQYRLGPAVFQLGRRYQQSFRLGDMVLPALRDLVDRSGETASFYVRQGDRDTCLYRVESPRPIRDAGVAEGDTFPIDGSAGSRVLSAFLGARGPQHDAVRRERVVVAHQSKRVAGASAGHLPRVRRRPGPGRYLGAVRPAIALFGSGRGGDESADFPTGRRTHAGPGRRRRAADSHTRFQGVAAVQARSSIPTGRRQD